MNISTRDVEVGAIARRATWLGAAAAIAWLLAAAPLHAQARVSAEQWFRRGVVMIGAQAGGAAFTDFQRGTAQVSSGSFAPAEFERRVSAKTTSTVGGSIAVWLSGTWGVRAGAAYAPSSFSVWNEDAAQRVLTNRSALASDPAYANLDVFLADASLLFRVPGRYGRVVPYGLAGGGLVRYRKSGSGELPPEARSRFSQGSWTSPAVVVGLGAAIPLQRRNLLLTFELTDHISRTPVDDAGAGEAFELAGVPLQLASERDRGGTDGVGAVNNVRLMVGLTLPIR